MSTETGKGPVGLITRKSCNRLRKRSTENNKNVRRVCPQDGLLNFRPLCDFLGKEMPGVPFSRLNEGAALAEKPKGFKKRSMLLILRYLALVAVSILVDLLAVGWLRR